MSDLVADLAEQGRTLTPKERTRLVDLLLVSLHEPMTSEIEQAWDREIERRVAAHERGEGQLFDAADVLAEARRIAP